MLLQQYLKANGLAMENDEVIEDGEAHATVTEHVESAESVIATGEALAANEAEIDNAESAAVSIENLIIQLESFGGCKSDLERVLVTDKLRAEFGRIGVSMENISLESADGGFSMEGVGDTLGRIGDAIGDAFAKVRAGIKDFFAKVADHAARSIKAYKKARGNIHGDIVMTPRQTARWLEFSGDTGNNPVKVYDDLAKASKQVLVDYVNEINSGVKKLNAQYRNDNVFFIIRNPGLYFNHHALQKEVDLTHYDLPGAPEFNFKWSWFGSKMTVRVERNAKVIPGQGMTIAKADAEKMVDSMITALEYASSYIRGWRATDEAIGKAVAQLVENSQRHVSRGGVIEKMDNAQDFGTFSQGRVMVKALWKTTSQVPRAWISYISTMDSKLAGTLLNL
jgi:hypothetical protein